MVDKLLLNCWQNSTVTYSRFLVLVTTIIYLHTQCESFVRPKLDCLLSVHGCKWVTLLGSGRVTLNLI